MSLIARFSRLLSEHFCCVGNDTALNQTVGSSVFFHCKHFTPFDLNRLRYANQLTDRRLTGGLFIKTFSLVSGAQHRRLPFLLLSACDVTSAALWWDWLRRSGNVSSSCATRWTSGFCWFLLKLEGQNEKNNFANERKKESNAARNSAESIHYAKNVV